jgi:hypothetical protein
MRGEDSWYMMRRELIYDEGRRELVYLRRVESWHESWGRGG